MIEGARVSGPPRPEAVWEENRAFEIGYGGARALGVFKVSRQHLATLLPIKSGEPPPSALALIDTQVWLNGAIKDHRKWRGERKAAYAHRLHALMLTAPVTKQWKQGTVLRRLFD